MSLHAPRPALPAEYPVLAQLWRDSWMDAHAAYVPEALTRLRTVEDFSRRLKEFGDAVRVAGPEGQPLGLCIVRDDELHQLFLARAARGTGLAEVLLRDGEARLAAAGITRAWLDAVAENTRACRFYTRMGWQDEGIRTMPLDTSEGPFKIPLRVFTKTLVPEEV